MPAVVRPAVHERLDTSERLVFAADRSDVVISDDEELVATLRQVQHHLVGRVVEVDRVGGVDELVAASLVQGAVVVELDVDRSLQHVGRPGLVVVLLRETAQNDVHGAEVQRHGLPGPLRKRPGWLPGNVCGAMGVRTGMRRIAILVALCACEPEESGDGTGGGSGATSTDDGAEESSGGESSSESGEESTGESENPCADGLEWDGNACIWPGCLTPDGGTCAVPAVCVGTVCVVPCSEGGECPSGLECDPPNAPPSVHGCYAACSLPEDCPDGMACVEDQGYGICVWPEE